MGVEHTGVVTGRGRFTLRPGRAAATLAWDEDLHFPWWLGGPAGGAVGGRGPRCGSGGATCRR
mgnify:CR=1 FL=1